MHFKIQHRLKGKETFSFIFPLYSSIIIFPLFQQPFLSENLRLLLCKRTQFFILIKEITFKKAVTHTHTSTWNETRHTHHDFHITNTLKGIVDAPISHLNEHFLDRFTEVLGVNTLRGPKLLGSCEFVLIDVHTNDPGCTGHLTAHDNCQSNSSQAKDSTRRAGLHLTLKTAYKVLIHKNQ